jgi:hypothetical protein
MGARIWRPPSEPWSPATAYLNDGGALRLIYLLPKLDLVKLIESQLPTELAPGWQPGM